MIKIENVSFRYEDEEDSENFALRDVSIHVKPGELVAIIGQNGSGKSTLSKLINAVYPPTEGRIVIDGIDTSDAEQRWNVRAAAGMVFQNPDNQMVATIVEEDVAFGPENLGVEPSEIRRRVDESLAIVGMSEFRYRAPNNLSGGQKQRVAIAGVLAMKPKCIIFDESTAMLDPSGRREVMNVIEKLNAEGMTILMVTHHMDEAVHADRIFVMDGGRIVMDGTPREVFRDTEKIQSLRLDVPHATLIGNELTKAGYEVGICLNTEELADRVVSLRSRQSVPTGAFAQEEPSAETPAEEKVPERERQLVADTADSGIFIENLVHTYDHGTSYANKAVDNVSLRIAPGELVGLIGHTGSGKSTLIQHINALLPPTSGKIVVSGLDIVDASHLKKLNKKELKIQKEKLIEVRKKVGLVFQYPEYQLFEESVLKDIIFGPLNIGVLEEEAVERAKRAMAIVGLDFETFKDKSPFELSGGQKRRVAIAGVLAMEPEVLILDEPTAGLDPKGRDEILDEVRELHKERRCTVIVVSHSMDDMANLAERLLVMSKGKVVLDGEPREVFCHDAQLERIGLGVPQVRKLVVALAKRGFRIDPQTLTPEEATANIVRVLGGNPC